MSVAPLDTGHAHELRTSDSDLARLAKAIGHPARVRILRLLLSRDSCYCGELVDELPLTQATVSQHLKVLRDAGLIQGEIEGPRVCYCASLEELARFTELLDGLTEAATGTGRGCCDAG